MGSCLVVFGSVRSGLVWFDTGLVNCLVGWFGLSLFMLVWFGLCWVYLAWFGLVWPW